MPVIIQWPENVLQVEALLEQYKQFNESDEVGCIILKGAGPKVGTPSRSLVSVLSSLSARTVCCQKRQNLCGWPLHLSVEMM